MDKKSKIKARIYIDESDSVLARLAYHNTDATKDFWNRTVIVISKDENLTKAHVRFLESRLIQITTQARRATLENGTSPDTPSLPESDIADMEYFLEQLLILLPVLNFSFATAVRSLATQTEQAKINTASPIFIVSGSDYNAKAQEIDGQFVILKGSRIRKEIKSYVRATYKNMRDELIKDGNLIDTDNKSLELKIDIPLSSPKISANGKRLCRIAA